MKARSGLGDPTRAHAASAARMVRHDPRTPRAGALGGLERDEAVDAPVSVEVRTSGNPSFRALRSNTRAPTEIWLYSVSLAALAEDCFPTMGAVLDAQERERAGRFRWPADRHAYVAAHALLRHGVYELAGVSPHRWRYRAAETGKPHLSPRAAAPGLAFSLSHTRGMALVAVARDVDLGVDVERADPGRPVAAIAEGFLHPREVSGLRLAATLRDRCTRFATLWTLKEAFVKAIGTGLSQSLDSFAFDPDAPDALSFDDASLGDPGAWRVWTCARDDYHLACVAKPPSGGAVRIVHAEMHYHRRYGWHIRDPYPTPAHRPAGGETPPTGALPDGARV